MSIALDTSADLGNNTGSTWTVSYTVSGPGPILFVSIMEQGANKVTGITYNGVALTILQSKQNVGADFASLWYLAAPATGANNIIVTSSSSNTTYGLAVSYTGVLATTPIDVSGTDAKAGSNPLKVTLVPTLANEWWTAFAYNNPGNNAAGSGATLRNTNDGNTNIRIYDSNGTISGSTDVNVTQTGAANMIAASFKPILSGGAFLFNFM